MKRNPGDLLFYDDGSSACYFLVLEEFEDHYLVYTWLSNNRNYRNSKYEIHRRTYKETKAAMEGGYCTKVN